MTCNLAGPTGVRAVDENRSERLPTAVANLERLREELDQLGLRVRKSAGAESRCERNKEAADTISIRAK
jgi:hypothetical protein